MSSNKRRTSNKRRPLISATTLTVRSEQAPRPNKHLPVISTAPQNAALIRRLTII